MDLAEGYIPMGEFRKRDMKTDLREKIAVFVVTVGEASLPDCLKALEQQDCLFDLKVIKNVSPMSAAFQKMLDLCERPYFVQVDADMILYSHAIRTLYEALAVAPSKIWMVAYPLHDRHLDKAIVGVKAYKHTVAQQFPYQNIRGCEVDQLNRAKQAGYSSQIVFRSTEDTSICLGDHGTHWTLITIFTRYKDLFERYRRDPAMMGWLGAWPTRLLERYQREPTELNLWALLGAIVGLTSDLEKSQGEKDFTRYETMPDLQTLRTHFGKHHGPSEVTFYLTDRCDFQCWFCKRQFRDFKERIITPEHVEKVLRKFPTAKSVCLAGFGEPLLHPHLIELIETLNRHGITPSLITNGALLEARAEDLAQVSLMHISVSLNESNAEAHAKTHVVQPAIFDTVLRGIRKMVGLGHCPVGISKVVTKQNHRDIPDFLRLATDLGVDFVNLINLLPHYEDPVDAQDFWDSVITLEDQGVLEALESYKKLPEARLVRIWPVPISRDGEKCPHVCQSPWRTLGISAGGFYSPCRRILPPSANFGNIDNPEVWNGGSIRDMRESVLGQGGSYEDLCKQCFASWGDY